MNSKSNDETGHNGIGRKLARRLRRQHYLGQIDSVLPAGPPAPTEPAHPAHSGHHAHAHPHKHVPAAVSEQGEGLRDQLLRLQAEFDNFRKRQKRDEQQRLDLANQRLIEQLLPVMDNFDRALKNPGESVQALLGGMEMVQKQFAEILKQNGVDKIEPLGQPFDPNLHEAVAVEPAGEHPDNEITEVYQDGYQLKGRLIRPAMVRVART